MPHFVIECSAPVLELADAGVLVDAVYDAAVSTALFAPDGPGGIKVRLRTYEHYRNVDGVSHFVHVFAWIMEGRTQSQKRDLAERIVDALAPRLPSVGIISVNVAEFERETYANAASRLARNSPGPDPSPTEPGR